MRASAMANIMASLLWCCGWAPRCFLRLLSMASSGPSAPSATRRRARRGDRWGWAPERAGRAQARGSARVVTPAAAPPRPGARSPVDPGGWGPRRGVERIATRCRVSRRAARAPAGRAGRVSGARGPRSRLGPAEVPELLPEHALLELARRGARDLAEVDDRVGEPVPREARLEVLAQLVLGRLG